MLEFTAQVEAANDAVLTAVLCNENDVKIFEQTTPALNEKHIYKLK